MRAEAVAMAESVRPPAVEMQQLVAKVNVATVLPDACASLDKTFERAQDLFQREEYEVAARNFRSVRLQSEEVLQKYETLLSTQPEIWLKWSREKAERVQDSNLTWDLWITLADIERQFGNREACHRAGERARKNANDQAFVDPVGGARDLVTFTRELIAHEDPDAARETIKEAASICENLKPASMAAYYNSQCAGLFARLGDAAGWTKHWEIARQNSSTEESSVNDSDPELAASRAYALADDPQKAFEYATECERKHRNRSRTAAAFSRSVMYAHIAFAEARLHRQDHKRTEMYEKAYAAACNQLASFKYSQEGNAIAARAILALADAEIGDCHRAWIGAINLLDARRRTQTMSEVIRRRLELGQYREAQESLQHIPAETITPPLSCWASAVENPHVHQAPSGSQIGHQTVPNRSRAGVRLRWDRLRPKTPQLGAAGTGKRFTDLYGTARRGAGQNRSNPQAGPIARRPRQSLGRYFAPGQCLSTKIRQPGVARCFRPPGSGPAGMVGRASRKQS